MTKNCMTQRGAGRLADTIEEYWRDRGYRGIETEIISHAIPISPDLDMEHLYFVRSNIGPDGYPPREAKRRVA